MYSLIASGEQNKDYELKRAYSFITENCVPHKNDMVLRMSLSSDIKIPMYFSFKLKDNIELSIEDIIKDKSFSLLFNHLKGQKLVSIPLTFLNELEEHEIVDNEIYITVPFRTFMDGILVCNQVSKDSLSGESNYLIVINDCVNIFETCSITFKEIFYDNIRRKQLLTVESSLVHLIQHSSYISPTNFTNITLDIPFENIHKGLYIYTNECNIDNLKSLKLSINQNTAFEFNKYMISKFCKKYKKMLYLTFDYEPEIKFNTRSTINFSRLVSIKLYLTFENETNNIDIYGYSLNKHLYVNQTIQMRYSAITEKQTGTYTIE